MALLFGTTSWLDSELQIQGKKKVRSPGVGCAVSICSGQSLAPKGTAPLTQVSFLPPRCSSRTAQGECVPGEPRNMDLRKQETQPGLSPPSEADRHTSLLQNWPHFVFLRWKWESMES